MEHKDDGGPAFPTKRFEKGTVIEYPGMSLRDWYAGMALQGMIASAANPNAMGWPKETDVVGEWAYKYADAMLEERKK